MAATVIVGSVDPKVPACSPLAMGWSLRCCLPVPRNIEKMLKKASVILSMAVSLVISADSLKSGLITWITRIGWPLWS